MSTLEKKEICCSWFSRKGNDRRENRDACSFFTGKNHTFAIVIDATEHSENAKYYVLKLSSLIMELISKEIKPDDEIVINSMRSIHEKLKIDFYPSDFRMCYAAILIRHDINKSWLFHRGDCRIGIKKENESIEWKTSVHSCATPLGEKFTIEHAKDPERHVVTKIMKSNRLFENPDVFIIENNNDTVWVIATDGLWIDKIMLGIDITELNDDASILELRTGKSGILVNSCCSNFSFVTS